MNWNCCSVIPTFALTAECGISRSGGGRAGDLTARALLFLLISGDLFSGAFA